MEKFWNKSLAKRLFITSLIGWAILIVANFVLLTRIYGCAGDTFMSCSIETLQTYERYANILLISTYLVTAVIPVSIIMFIMTRNRKK